MSDEPQTQPTQKPAILRDTTFKVQEGLMYRITRGGAIQLNKLFFAALILLGIWLIFAFATGNQDCTSSYVPVSDENGTHSDAIADTCSAFLTPTAKYLAGMAVISFIASIGLGLLGLVVGKKIIEMTPTAEEVGNPGDDKDE